MSPFKVTMFVILLMRGHCCGTHADPLTSRVPYKPNIILFLADDMGWGDLASFGHPTQESNALDTLSRDGAVMRNMYAADSVCSPSRAALLTARLPRRIGVSSSEGNNRDFSRFSTRGLPLDEVTIPEALRSSGYTSGFVGKWNLGINRANNGDGYYLPDNHGFDFVGLNLPLGNSLMCEEVFFHYPEGPVPNNCFLYNNSTLIQQPFRHENLTLKMVQQCKDFLTAHQNGPFFFMFAFYQTHTALQPSSQFANRSARGVYGDAVNELAQGVKDVLDHVENLGIAEETLVVFTSDNGPSLKECTEGGDPGLFSGGKGTFWEGGIRVPTIVRMPGYIEPGSYINTPATLMDLLPTFVELAGGDASADIGQVLDGRSLVDTLFRGGRAAHDNLFFFCGEHLFAVRRGPLKLVYRSHVLVDRDEMMCMCPHGYHYRSLCEHHEYYGCDDSTVVRHDPPLIYNIDHDPREMYPLPGSNFTDLIQVVAGESAELLLTFDGEDPYLLDYMSCDVIPCCNVSDQYCSCNYPGHTFTHRDCPLGDSVDGGEDNTPS